MLYRVGSALQNHLLNIAGAKLTKRIVVLESDDWGSVRVPSLEVYDSLVAKGIKLYKNPYNVFDALEEYDDLSALFDVLSAHKDRNGNHPVVTLNFVVANPDFDAIKQSNFEHYAFEVFSETYKRKGATEKNLSLLLEAVQKGLVNVQFHSREHVNALAWLKYLQQRDREFMLAFESGVFSIDKIQENGKRDNLMASLDYANDQERFFSYNQLKEGIEIFSNVFKSNPTSFIAPCNVWDEGAEKVLAENGIRYIQSLRNQKIPISNGYKSRTLTTGSRSIYNQIYTVRNAYFEPSTIKNYDWVGNCLRKIEVAFFWKKPAIISTHRLNYIGSLHTENRKVNLSLLNTLLTQIVKRFPDVEFLSSDKVASLYVK